MHRIFLPIYHFFKAHKALMYVLMIASALVFAFFGFTGKPAAYMIVFCICAVAYLIGWSVMKALVPKYKPVIVK